MIIGEEQQTDYKVFSVPKYDHFKSYRPGVVGPRLGLYVGVKVKSYP